MNAFLATVTAESERIINQARDTALQAEIMRVLQRAMDTAWLAARRDHEELARAAVTAAGAAGANVIADELMERGQRAINAGRAAIALARKIRQRAKGR